MCSLTNWSWPMGKRWLCIRSRLLLDSGCCGSSLRMRRRRKKNKVQEAASNKISATRQTIHQQWSDLRKKGHEPGKMHKLKRIILAQLPVHPQYLDAGTSFNANLLQPLNFGTRAVKPGAMIDIGAPPPTGSVVCAAGDRFELSDGEVGANRSGDYRAAGSDQIIILPEGSLIKGSVMQVAPARRLGRNGQLRILFVRLRPLMESSRVGD